MSPARKMPEQAVLLKLLSYDADTGFLFWRPRLADMFADRGHSAQHSAALWNARYAGKRCFAFISIEGYLIGNIFSVKYPAHRIIWKMQTGEDPNEIDHIDGNRKNNLLANLRNVSRSENCRNVKIRSTNKSGYTGVHRHSHSGNWHASIYDGKRIHLGSFKSLEAAIEARKAAEPARGFHANHGRAA